MGEYKHALNIA